MSLLFPSTRNRQRKRLRMPFEFCANLSFMFQETKNLLERYHLAKQAGFKYVESAFPYEYKIEDVVKAKKDAGVEQVLMNAYPGDMSKGFRGFAALPGKRSEFKASIELAISYAQALECKMIHIMAGAVENPTTENFKVYKENIKLAASMLQDADMVGLLEPINTYSVPNYFLDTYEKAIEVLDYVNSPSMKLQLDVFHLQHIRGNLTRNIIEMIPYIGHIQIAQVPDRHEPDSPGEIDYKYILKMIEHEQYFGYIGLEYIPERGTVEGLKWVKSFGFALDKDDLTWTD